MVYVHLASGFEEVEALTVVDLLRRGKIDTEMVSVTGNKTVRGTHGIDIIADTLFEEADYDACEMIVLPGGSLGTAALDIHERLAEKLADFARKGKWIAAICAAPSVLARKNLLAGKRATIYTDLSEEIMAGKGIYKSEKVVVDGKFITSRSLGTAIDFALAIIKALKGERSAARIEKTLLR
jgi:4-methyl-5(b-hydroxyethyl)-thiazole monophosphate biosynthesis